MDPRLQLVLWVLLPVTSQPATGSLLLVIYLCFPAVSLLACPMSWLLLGLGVLLLVADISFLYTCLGASVLNVGCWLLLELCCQHFPNLPVQNIPTSLTLW